MRIAAGLVDLLTSHHHSDWVLRYRSFLLRPKSLLYSPKALVLPVNRIWLLRQTNPIAPPRRPHLDFPTKMMIARMCPLRRSLQMKRRFQFLIVHLFQFHHLIPCLNSIRNQNLRWVPCSAHPTGLLQALEVPHSHLTPD